MIVRLTERMLGRFFPLLDIADLMLPSVDAAMSRDHRVIIAGITSTDHPGHMAERRRLNVMVSRNKDLLIVVGRRDSIMSRSWATNELPLIIDGITRADGAIDLDITEEDIPAVYRDLLVSSETDGFDCSTEIRGRAEGNRGMTRKR